MSTASSREPSLSMPRRLTSSRVFFIEAIFSGWPAVSSILAFSWISFSAASWAASFCSSNFGWSRSVSRDWRSPSRSLRFTVSVRAS